VVTRLLESLGLDELTERVYRLLLSRRDLGIEAIADELSATVDQIRIAFDRLAELALLRPSWESPGGLRPVSPEAGLQILVQRRQAEVLRQQQQIAEAQAEIAGLVSEYADLRPATSRHRSESVLGMDAIQTRIEELAMAAHLEVVSFMPRGAHDPRAVEAAKPLDLEVRNRGVAMRTVALDSIRNDGPTLAYAQWLIGIGAEVRTAPTLPIRMLIYDRKTAILPLDPNDTRKGTVEVSDRGTVTAVFALFEQVWSLATPIGAAPAKDDVGLSAQERQLLKLLAEGMTDEGAGRQLGLSQRTVRRMMAGIMERLGARSRFEAGCRATQQGWL
jgi:DNA-binding CsgD family transcriptional regulator/sugar-specific transcriptional regulator TrmB